MIIGDRIKAIRELKNMSQGDIERRTGLLRCYISLRREWSYCPGDRDVGEDSAGDGGSHVPALFRCMYDKEHRVAEVAQSEDFNAIWQGCACPFASGGAIGPNER